MTWGIDVSFAHASTNYASLAMRGASFVIGYSSDHPEKNLTKADVHNIRSQRLTDLLVFENIETDMIGGRGMGRVHGDTAVTQARAIGYDWQGKPIFAANDRDAHPNDFATILAYMEGFAESVPHPGYYGDQDSIDYLYARHPGWVFWQSSSLAYGDGISQHADIVQRYDDSRVRGWQVDANDVVSSTIPWIGDDMFNDADRAMLTKIAGQMQTVSYTEGIELPAIAEMRGNVQNIAKGIVGFKPGMDPVTLAAALAPLLHTVDPHQLIDALSQVLSKVSLSVAG